MTVLSEWTQRLRNTPKSERGRYVLKEVRNDKPKYCAVGVLCEMAVEAGVIEPSGASDFDTIMHRYGGAAGQAPIAVVKWSGVTSGLLRRVSTWNDTNTPWEEIADA